MDKKILLTILLCSCASIHQGYQSTEATVTKNNTSEANNQAAAKTINTESPFVVSAYEVKNLSSKHFAHFDFTIENKTARYVKIKSARLDFGNDAINNEIQVPTGRKLVAWAKAAQQNKVISDYNAQLALLSIATLGTGLMFSSNIDVASVGLATAVGASAGSAVHAIGSERQRIGQTITQDKESTFNIENSIPETHLYSGGFEVPPGLHTKKWITFYTEHPEKIPFISTAKLILTYEDGSEDTRQLKLRTFASAWQADRI